MCKNKEKRVQIKKVMQDKRAECEDLIEQISQGFRDIGDQLKG